jgi:branched-chain amino acid transport system ATP-binding protein
MKKSSTAERILSVESATVNFGGVTALRDVSLAVDRGEYVGLIGPNGSGKTTLLNVVSGVVRPAAGKVAIGGVLCTHASVHKRSRLGIARSFQRAVLFPELTVAEHLTLAVDPKGLLPGQKTTAVADRVELFRDQLAAEPWQLDMSQPISSLAQGGVRAVELAMALLGAPRLLLLDEPLSGLDRSERDALAAVTLKARESWDVSVVMVEHDIESVVRLADRLVVLDFGEKIADGPTAPVIRDERVRRAYFGSQTDIAPQPESS